MPTLRDARRWLARTKIRRYRQVTAGVQASPPAGSYVGIAAGSLTTDGDDRRAIVSSDLASRGVADGDDVRSDLYDGWYAYALTADPEQRRIALDGFTPNALASSVTDQASSVYVGYLVADNNYGAVIPAGTVVELHGHPPQDADGAPGLHTFINQALKGMRGMTRRVSISAVAGQQAYSLAAYGVTRQWQLAQVLGDGLSGLEPYSAPGSAVLRTDGAVTYLVFRGGAPAVGTFYADLYLPRDAWIAPAGSGGVFASSSVGLVDDLDEATGDLNEIALVAYYHYCEYRALGADGELNAGWAARARRAAEIAAPFLEHGADVPVDAWSGRTFGSRLVEQGGAGSDWDLTGAGGGVSWP